MLNNEPALIVAAMKNEGPYILEWVPHHIAVGFGSFIVITNDCDDLTDRILDRMERLIPLKHVPNPKALFSDRSNWHVMAHRYASLFNLYKDAGWIYFKDPDEFLMIWAGGGHLDDFYEETVGFDVVSFTSMPFGSGGVVDIVDEPVVSQFTTQSKDYDALRAAGRQPTNAVKTMFHNKVKFSVRRNHRPRRSDFSTTGYRWIDGSGNEFPPEWTDGSSKGALSLTTVDLAQFNHYAIRSAEAYLVKIDRGDAVGATRLDPERRYAYWRDYDARGTVDTRAATPSPEATRLREEFLSDPVLGALHSESVAHHRKKAKHLRSLPEFAPLLEGLGLGRAG
ncbi:glycosyltransferase family 2 protein [Rhodophyticola porphyridii]|uniref:Glycosyltransferase family 2 protein n=1 Tax=Rhodophyticola porphyridii TaxID=1852017 RepID=A0A3L9Y6G8_9RHOB|nr:glycosyltransferase family 2 protein [Rhodophyticola porphyridii]RMA41706.1 glycosyltransferase family 2 protein [Rhodophyticola porphyridii]